MNLNPRDRSFLAVRPLRILCAEDNALVGEMLRHLLARAGHEVEAAADGLAAWERVSQDLGFYDVVITDHQMPHVNGLELVELLHQASYRGRVVVHCSWLSPEVAERYRALGVSAIVFKAGDGEALLRVVAQGADNQPKL